MRSLRGFERVSLDPGQTKHVTISLDQRSFQYWDETSQQWLDNYGSRRIYVGDSSADGEPAAERHHHADPGRLRRVRHRSAAPCRRRCR